MLISVGISVGISIIWMLFVQFLPKIAIWVAFALAIVLLIITAMVFFFDAQRQLARATGWAVFLALFALLIAIILIFYIIVHNRRISYCGIFLQNATYMIK